MARAAGKAAKRNSAFMKHLPAIPFNRENSDFRLEMPTPRKTERGWIRH